MKSKIKQLAKLFTKKKKQIQNQSPKINIINFNRNKFGFPMFNNEENIESNKPK